MSTTYNQEVAPKQTGSIQAIDNAVTDDRLNSIKELLDNQINSDEQFEYDNEFDVQSEPNYGPPGTGAKVIGNEKVEHKNQPLNSFDGGSNQPLRAIPPGAARAEVGTYEDASSVSKNSKITEEDETRVGGSTGSYVSQLSLMLGGTTILYVKGVKVKYSNTTAGGEAGTGSCKALGNDLNKISEEQFEKDMFIPTVASRPDTFGDLTNVVRTKTGKVVRTASGAPVRTKG